MLKPKSNGLSDRAKSVALRRKEASLPSTETSVSTKVLPKVKVEDSEGLISRMYKIIEVLDANRLDSEFNDASEADFEFYRAALIDTLEMIPLAKSQYVNFQNSANVYAYNGLVTKAQELLADLSALSDKSNLLSQVIDNILTPAMSGITANLGNSYTMLASEVRSMGLSESDSRQVLSAIQRMVRGLGNYLQDTQNALNAKVTEQFEDN